LVLVFLIYSNTFDAGWHFDDRHSIVDNAKIHISELSLASISQAIQHPDSDRLWRPLAYLSFALNWYFGQDEVFGYHLTNILIHFLTALILYHTLLLLFRSPVLQDTSAADAHVTSFLTSILWAVHPIQTQAVTYIVQRMTLLAALFYLSAVFLYLRGRLVDQSRVRYLYFISCGVCWLLALSAKENAILLPLGLLLVDGLFFRNLNASNNWKWYFAIFLVAVLAIGILGGFYIGSNPLSLLAGYNDRFFTLSERLMTQPRVLIFYLSQIFFPHPARLSIEHDFAVSTSLLDPWTTLPAILILLGLIIAAVVKRSHWTLLSFSILFFFMNHAIESSVVPLELVFEHRNYLPSMFIFAPVAAELAHLLGRYERQQPLFFLIILSLSICLISGLGIATYWRNRVWSDEISLWSDARRKAPSMHRPVHNLAMTLYDRNGRFDDALRLYHKADELIMHRRSHRAWLYSNIANIHYRAGRYNLAEEYYLKAHAIAPTKDLILLRLAETLGRQKKLTAALNHVETLLARNPQNSDYLNLKGNILLQQRRPEQALAAFRANLKNNPRQASAYVNAGRALAAIGRFGRAEKLVKAGIGLDPENLKLYIRLLDIYLRRSDDKSAGDLSRFLIGSATVQDIRMTVQELADDPYVTRGDVDNMLNAIAVELGARISHRSALDPVN
jgi:tetratricopeptide (TPR) repeat protein